MAPRVTMTWLKNTVWKWQPMSKLFDLVSDYSPSGDQPTAITRLLDGLDSGLAHQTLLGVTGSGKTFTLANVISQSQRPAILLAPNKTLAAQLYGEMKSFFQIMPSSTSFLTTITTNQKLTFRPQTHSSRKMRLWMPISNKWGYQRPKPY